MHTLQPIKFTVYALLWIAVLAFQKIAYSQTERVVSAGVQVDLKLDLVSKIATFTFIDASTASQITTARPAAWMQLRRSEQIADELSCEAKAMQLSTGSLGTRADVDMNTYRLVTLNEDATVAFINPLVKLNNSRLESIVQLPSKGYDWVLSHRTKRLFISLRDTNQIAVIDTLQRRLLKIIDVAKHSLPTRMVIDEDTDTVWVGLDGLPEIIAVDARTLVVKAQVQVQAGLHTLSLVPNEPWLWATNAKTGSVSIVHRTTFRKLADVYVGKSPVSVEWSNAARRAVVLSIEDGVLSQIDPLTSTVTHRLVLEHGVLKTAMFDGGRYAIAINHKKNRASLVDLASSSVLDEASVTLNPDQILISREFAYVRGQGSPNVTMLNIKQARAGKLTVATVSLGRKAPFDEEAGVNVASAIVLAPEGNGIYIANAADKSVYRYTEGLMAANGSFSNYARAARGLMVLDSSLAQSEPGVFSAAFNAQKSGRYDVVIRNANPAFVACFIAQIDQADTQVLLPETPTPQFLNLVKIAANDYEIHISLKDSSGVVPNDAVLLAIVQHGGWQQRILFRKDRLTQFLVARVSIPDGIGIDDVQAIVSSASINLRFSDGYLGLFSNLLQKKTTSHLNQTAEVTR
jgi:hypothetical protein